MDVVIQAREDIDQCLVYSLLPYAVPLDKRIEFATHLHRVNYDLPIGNFEFNLDDGTVRFKTSFDGEGQTINRQTIQNLVFPNVLTTEHYHPVFSDVISGGDWDTALAKIDE